MKKLLLALPLAFLWLMSCKQEEKILVEKEITFSIANPAQTGSNGGRIAAAAEPKSVLVTIKDIDGTTVADRKELTLYKFGENFLSLPLTLKTSGASKYHLTEFLVVSTDNKVNYATPKEGSKLAHLVADPLDIEFAVRKDTITTVTPEVLAIDENTNPEDYGYGQFGFKVVKTISAIFSAFLKGTNNFELTTAHLKIQGLRDSTSRDTTSLWVYETNLEAKANTVQLKEAGLYRVTSTKQGYRPWNRTLAIKNNDKFEILFEEVTDSLDIYAAGSEQIKLFNDNVATYWKNGVEVRLSTVPSTANMIFVSQGDIYLTGYERESLGRSNAFYWKNGQKVNLPQIGNTFKIFVQGSDVHVIGTYNPSQFSFAPAYWKNGVFTQLKGTGKYSQVTAFDIAVDGKDVYICGHEGPLTTTNKGDSYPLLWKNGELVDLPLPSSDYKRTFVTSIKVEKGHVYASGSTAIDPSFPKLIYWKDNAIALLKPDGYAWAMSIQDGTAHIIGNTATYWKDGIETTIPESNINSNFFCIDTNESNVAIAGKYNGLASYWLNGNLVILGKKASHVSSIFLTRK